MDSEQRLGWLRETSPSRLETLWRMADTARRRGVGDAVHLRGLVEFSNHCARLCGYCGLRADNRSIVRYRMSAAEVLQCARTAHSLGYGTVVLQSGEDWAVTRDWVADVVRSIKAELNLAVTLSLGERTDDDLAAWREAGADRYLLRFETSNPALYERIHPGLPGRKSDRFAILRRLRALGYEVGSGVMVGIPGQSYEDLAADLQAFQDLDLDMIGIGPYLPHPETPLGRSPEPLPPGEQAPNTELMTCKMVALARLACPEANIPSTTALATLNGERGRENGLQRGANVVMPNVTPPVYRQRYEIYPGKACITEDAARCSSCLTRRIGAIGRRIGTGRGAAPNYRKDRI